MPALLLVCAVMLGTASVGRAGDEPRDAVDETISRVYVLNRDGSEPTLLTTEPESGKQGSPDWSADGKLIAFDTVREKLGERIDSARIGVMNADGSNVRILGDGVMPSFSPQGHRIAFSRVADRGVWVMSSEGPEKELVLIDDQGWGTDWSPDGTRIAYTRNRNGGNLVVFNIVEGTRHTLFDEGDSPYRQIFWNFAWSPDSKSIVFKGTRRDGKAEMAIVDARGADHGLKSRYVADILPAMVWSPDGRQVLFSMACPEREKRLQLYALDPTTNDPPVLLEKQPAGMLLKDTAYSPDGKKIAVMALKPAPRP